MKKSKGFPETLYVEKVEGHDGDIFPASVNPVDFSEKGREVELAEYKLVRKVKVHQSVRIEYV